MNAPLSEATMRTAVDQRDGNFDGRFVYGVITTGVFCRPSCPSRRARPENLRFFSRPADAREAGFRPCKRCCPDAPGSDVERMVRVARSIAARPDEKLSLAKLAAQVGLSPTHFQKSFQSVLGVSPKMLHAAARLDTFKALLKAGHDVTYAIVEAGYGSPSRVYDRAQPKLGMTPSRYRQGGSGESLSYACRNTRLGWLMMAGTDHGVCFAMFGEDEPALLESLRHEFPQAETQPSSAVGDPSLDAWMTALDAYLAEGGPRPQVPLDLQGTAFQIRVWRFLTQLREGQIVSYLDVAKGLDRPQASRAVASACARNRVAVLVPCHRVLRSNGELGGYRWGLTRKQALIDAERNQALPRSSHR